MDIAQIGIGISLLSVSVAVLRLNKSKSNGNLTCSEADKRYKQIIVCDEVHKRTDEKLQCIPEIKTDVTKIKVGLGLLLKKSGIDINIDDGK